MDAWMLTSGRSRATRTGLPKLGRVNSAQQAMLLSMGAHFGFQAVVTVVVYPALFEVSQADWQDRHSAHSRRIAFVVVPIYAAVISALAWTLSSLGWSPALLVAICAILLVLLTTSLVAAPLHKTLARDGPTPKLKQRLRRADAIRLGGAALACAAAIFV